MCIYKCIRHLISEDLPVFNIFPLHSCEVRVSGEERHWVPQGDTERLQQKEEISPGHCQVLATDLGPAKQFIKTSLKEKEVLKRQHCETKAKKVYSQYEGASRTGYHHFIYLEQLLLCAFPILPHTTLSRVNSVCRPVQVQTDRITSTCLYCSVSSWSHPSHTTLFQTVCPALLCLSWLESPFFLLSCPN